MRDVVGYTWDRAKPHRACQDAQAENFCRLRAHPGYVGQASLSAASIRSLAVTSPPCRHLA